MTDHAHQGFALDRDPGTGTIGGDTPETATGGGGGGGLVPGPGRVPVPVRGGTGVELAVVASGTRKSRHNQSSRTYMTARLPVSCLLAVLCN